MIDKIYSASDPEGIPEATKTQVLKAFNQLPLSFIPNAGQVDPRVCYYLNGSGHQIFFTPEAAVFFFVKQPLQSVSRKRAIGRIRDAFMEDTPTAQGFALFLRYIGANPCIPEGRIKGIGQVSYFIGNDPDRWHRGLSTFKEIIYRDLWPGVDMVFKGDGGRLKYEFVLHPGSDLNSVKLAYGGADSLSLDDRGNLQILTPLGILTDERPVGYQVVNGRRVSVDVEFSLGRGANGEDTCIFPL